MPTKKFDADDFGAFLALLPEKQDGLTLRHVVEVRHPSFRTPEFIALLAKHNAAVVCADHADYPMIADVTSDFVYARLQTGSDDVETCYDEKRLDLWADRLKTWASGGVVDDLDLGDPRTSRKRNRAMSLPSSSARARSMRRTAHGRCRSGSTDQAGSGSMAAARSSAVSPSPAFAPASPVTPDSGGGGLEGRHALRQMRADDTGKRIARSCRRQPWRRVGVDCGAAVGRGDHRIGALVDDRRHGCVWRRRWRGRPSKELSSAVDIRKQPRELAVMRCHAPGASRLWRGLEKRRRIVLESRDAVGIEHQFALAEHQGELARLLPDRQIPGRGRRR